MLKIRDDIDLKKLEKYGFEVIGNFAKRYGIMTNLKVYQ